MTSFENPTNDTKNSFLDFPQKIEPEDEVEKKEGKRIKNIEIKIGENTYSLEAESYDFEYPKKIQEETGIIGYERTKISNESRFNFYKSLYKIEYDLDFEKYHICNEADLVLLSKDVLPKARNMSFRLKELKEKKKSYEDELGKKDAHLNPLLGGTWEKWESFYNRELNEIKKQALLLEDECSTFYNNIGVEDLVALSSKYTEIRDNGIKDYRLLMALSREEYPRYTYNHIMGGYANDKEGLKMREEFRDDKFFVQNIYDRKRIEKKLETSYSHRIYNYPDAPDPSTAMYSNISFFKKDSLENITEGGRTHVGNIPQYNKLLDDGKVFGASVYGGLNCAAGEFFFGKNSIKELSFGFSLKLASFQKEYFEKSLDELLDLQEALSSINKKYIPKSIVNTIQILLFNKILDEPILLEKIKNAIFDKYDEVVAKFEHKAELLVFLKEEVFGEFLKEYPKVAQTLNIDDTTEQLFNPVNTALRVVTEKVCTGWNLDQEVFLPIFIGHDEIPQLSWGHAKYAHYMNEKGFNFFKFKHADHLPKKLTP